MLINVSSDIVDCTARTPCSRVRGWCEAGGGVVVVMMANLDAVLCQLHLFVTRTTASDTANGAPGYVHHALFRLPRTHCPAAITLVAAPSFTIIGLKKGCSVLLSPWLTGRSAVLIVVRV